MRPLMIVLIALSPMAAQAADVQEGLWDISLTMTTQGQSFGPYNKQQCFTKADTQDPSRLFAESTGGCEYTNKKYFGNQFNFNVRCTGNIPLSGTGQVEFSSDRFRGSMNLTAQMAGGPSVESVSEISGKRLGDCQ
jgi:hypothetical protein